MKKETFATMTIGDARAVYKAAKAAKSKVEGRINITFTDKMEGLSIRNAYGTNLKKMFGVFSQFTRPYTDTLKKPFVDFERNVVISTNGWTMLLTDIPKGTAMEDFRANGFADEREVNVCWWNAISPKDREVSDYNLANMNRLAVIEKGGSLHNTLMAMAECAKSYEFTDDDGCWHTIYGYFGQKVYNIRSLAAVVTAVFKMGNTKIGLYEPNKGWAGSTTDIYAPMHIVGLDSGNNSRGLVMPIRHYGPTDGAFVFPIDGNAAKAA